VGSSVGILALRNFSKGSQNSLCSSVSPLSMALSTPGFKDIVLPKKRGVERGTIRTVLTSYTIADIFFEHLKG
jgi:hypothetical protein